MAVVVKVRWYSSERGGPSAMFMYPIPFSFEKFRRASKEQGICRVFLPLHVIDHSRTFSPAFPFGHGQLSKTARLCLRRARTSSCKNTYRHEGILIQEEYSHVGKHDKTTTQDYGRRRERGCALLLVEPIQSPSDSLPRHALSKPQSWRPGHPYPPSVPDSDSATA